MKLYCDPISTTSRPVLMFIAEHGIDAEVVKVDLMAGQHRSADYLALNPNGIVPFLVDGDLKLGESAAILKYLAQKVGSPAYPTDLKSRIKVDEAISWFSTQFHAYFCLFTCYPNMGVPHGLDAEIGQGMMAYGREHAVRWLAVLDQHMLSGGAYVCGDEITIADYLGLSYTLLNELADFDLSPYPNIQAWISRMRARPSFEPTYAPYFGLLNYVKSQRAAAA